MGMEPDVWATVGLHPHDAVDGVGTLDDLLADPSLRIPDAPVVVAVGECGLDYHYDHSPRDVQREAFASQIRLAHHLDLALVIHTRNAWDDTFALLDSERPPTRTIFHCFTGGAGEARRALDLGAWLSFSGIVTFRSADDVRDAARLCPPARMLVETDSPYLAPVPHRGRPNRPALVAVVGAAVAEVRSEPVATVEDATWAATAAVFRLPDDA
jgi:TatD DNase family protein